MLGNVSFREGKKLKKQWVGNEKSFLLTLRWREKSTDIHCIATRRGQWDWREEKCWQRELQTECDFQPYIAPMPTNDGNGGRVCAASWMHAKGLFTTECCSDGVGIQRCAREPDDGRFWKCRRKWMKRSLAWDIKTAMLHSFNEYSLTACCLDSLVSLDATLYAIL